MYNLEEVHLFVLGFGGINVIVILKQSQTCKNGCRNVVFVHEPFETQLHGSLKSWCKGEKNEGPSYILQRHKDVTLYSNTLRWS